MSKRGAGAAANLSRIKSTKRQPSEETKTPSLDIQEEEEEEEDDGKRGGGRGKIQRGGKRGGGGGASRIPTDAKGSAGVVGRLHNQAPNTV